MIKNYKKIVLVIFMISIFFLSNSAHAHASSTTVTDPTDDVTLVKTTQGNTGAPNIYTQTVSSQPNIDILTASYTANANGSVSISLTVKGQIEKDNHTYYKIQLVGNYLSSTLARTTIITLYYTSLFSVNFQSIVPNTQYSYRNGSVFGFGPMHSYANGSTLTTTLGTNLTTSTNNNFTVALPKSFPENQVVNDLNTTWHIITWHGNSTTDAYGTQYFDYFPNTDNVYVYKINVTPISNTPGFEVISILAIPVIIVMKKKLKS